MESKQNNEKNTPMQNILLEKAADGKFPRTFGCDSPFRILPPASTPPSRFRKIVNPFERQLTEKLHSHVFSPSVFSNATTKTVETFKWAIEDISILKPADIDETTVDQLASPIQDYEVEQTVQAKIERYFNEKHIVPSPLDVAIKRVPLVSESTSPIKSELRMVDGEAQTILSLPLKLPENVEAVLKPFFSYTLSQQQNENKDSSLHRQLFEFDDPQTSPTSVLTSPAPSCNISPIDFSPYNNADLNFRRNYGSLQENLDVPDCNISPIDSNIAHVSVHCNVGRNFIDHMSIDTSLNLVPDMLDELPCNNQSLAFESVNSPITEALSNSSINWDLEYNHVSLASPKSHNSSFNEMDVSNSITPKSKIFISQRKKLSDSFLKAMDSDEDKENVYNRKLIKNNLFIQNDITDMGYHTGTGLTMSEESWSSSLLFASTPTKSRYKE